MTKASLTLALALSCTAAGPAVAFDVENFVGTVVLVAGSYCPRGTLEAKGGFIYIDDNPTLYSVLGHAYGGEGESYFGIPNLSGHVPVKGMRYCLVAEGTLPPRP